MGTVTGKYLKWRRRSFFVSFGKPVAEVDRFSDLDRFHTPFGVVAP